MENHISHIEQLGSVHIGTQAVLDNRQPLEGSEFHSESLPALMMDNTKPGVYQHLRFHLNSDDVYVDCFVHEGNMTKQQMYSLNMTMTVASQRLQSTRTK